MRMFQSRFGHPRAEPVRPWRRSANPKSVAVNVEQLTFDTVLGPAAVSILPSMRAIYARSVRLPRTTATSQDRKPGIKTVFDKVISEARGK